MKKKTLLSLTLCFIFIMTFIFSACAGEAKIESINGNSTIYRYTIKRIELVDSDSQIDSVLETNTQFKYYYCKEERPSTNVSFSAETIFFYFDDIQYDHQKAYSAKYEKYVYMRVIFDERPKAYRPKLSTRNGLTKVTYYGISSYNDSSFSAINYYLIAKNEITYSSYLNAQKEYAQRLSELRNDETAKEELETRFKETYEHTAILTKFTESFNPNTQNIYVTYLPR